MLRKTDRCYPAELKPTGLNALANSSSNSSASKPKLVSKKSNLRMQWKLYKYACKVYLNEEPSVKGFKKWRLDDAGIVTSENMLPELRPTQLPYSDSSLNPSNNSAKIPALTGKPVDLSLHLNRPRREQLEEINQATLAALQQMTPDQRFNALQKSFNRAALAYYTGAIEQERYRTIRDYIIASNMKVSLPQIPVTIERNAFVRRQMENIDRERIKLIKRREKEQEKELKELGKISALLGILNKGKR